MAMFLAVKKDLTAFCIELPPSDFAMEYPQKKDYYTIERSDFRKAECPAEGIVTFYNYTIRDCAMQANRAKTLR